MISSDKRVIYIGGDLHNGSSILGVILGNHPNVFYAGELSPLPREGWLGDSYCACGQPINQCAFWNDVKKIWENNSSGKLAELISLENSIDRNRRFPDLLLKLRIHSNTFQKYSLYTKELFAAIQEISEKPVVVDTSKRISRALALSYIYEKDLSIIHLVRDSRGVADSWAKPYRAIQRGYIDSSIRWMLTNLAYEMAKKRIGSDKILFIRYEDLLTNTDATLNKIGIFTQINLLTVSEMLSGGDILDLGHTGIGNDFLRRKHDVRFQTNIDWPVKLSKNTQKKVWLLTSGLMTKYGYKP